MAVKYVKDFGFDSSFGFTGSSGKTPVRAYMRGGAVKSNPTKAPSIAPAMVEKRSQGLGGLTPETKKLAAYNKPHTAGKKGAKVAQYAKGGVVKKAHAKKEMPSFLKAKMMKKANGGPVAEITAGDGMSPLQMMQQEDPPLKPLPPDDPRLLPSLPPLGNDEPLPEAMPRSPGIDRTYVKPIYEILGMTREDYAGPTDVGPMISEEYDAPRLREDLYPIGDLMPLPEEPNYSDMPMGVMGGGDDYWRKGGIKDQQAERSRQWEISKGLRPPTSAPIKSVSDFAPKLIAGLGPMMPGAPVSRPPIAGEPGFGTSQGVRPSDELRKPYRGPNAEELAAIDALRRQTAAVNSGMDLQGTRGVKGSPLAEAARMAPQDRRAMRADRNEMARDIMDRYIAGPRRAMGARGVGESRARRAMPVAPSEPMIKIPRGPRGGVATFAKGGKVSKGEAKVGKVMGEFKRGELHSGSKKGPVVKNPKQAVAIALSEARAAGAKMPKRKAMGGKACG